MPLSLHEKSWHVDHVLAQAITHQRSLLTRLLPAHPEATEGRLQRLKGERVEGGEERSWLWWVRSYATVHSHNSELDSISAGHAENHGKTRLAINHSQ